MTIQWFCSKCGRRILGAPVWEEVKPGYKQARHANCAAPKKYVVQKKPCKAIINGRPCKRYATIKSGELCSSHGG